MLLNLENKKILITGASRGLGSVCARVLSEYDTKLVLIARTMNDLERVRLTCKNYNSHLSIPCDITNIKELELSITTAKYFLGDVDIIIHAAGGGLGLHNPLISYHDLLTLFILNVSVPVEINRLVIPDMIKQKSGNIIHIGSLASREISGSVGYNTVKAALSAYVRSIGRETAIHNVITTGILPGGFYAPENSWSKLPPEIVTKYINDNLPRKIMGNVEELIPFILLLCSDKASMMSGCMIPIDAGQGKAYI